MSFLRQGLTLWKAFAKKLGAIQTTVLLSLAYLVIGSVVSLCALIFRIDLLGLRRSRITYWLDRQQANHSANRLSQQF